MSKGDSIKMTQEETNTHVFGIVMLQQFSLKAGLKHFRRRGKDAVTSELTQMLEVSATSHQRLADTL
eukprot:1435490-Ditylum_brightwellii.AAC.1